MPDTMPHVLVVSTAEAAGELAADMITAVVQTKPAAVLGLATGSSPLPVYRALARRVRDGLDLRQVTWFALDEYVGLPASHPERYRAVLLREAVEPLGLDPERVRVPGDDGSLVETAGQRYEADIADAGGVDLQLLGLGTNGHIGFNEPVTPFASITRVTPLTPSTRRDNARFFDSEDAVPTHSITQGISTILRARRLVLLAFGRSKAAALARALEGPIDPATPASAIQDHPNTTVLVDQEAAEQLGDPHPGHQRTP